MRQKLSLFKSALMLLISIQLFSLSAFAAVDMSASRGDVASYVGSFSHGVQIGVAPGRAGMQPALALQYSSSRANGLYGYGWDLDITRIELNTKMGAPKYSAADTYLLVMKGARQALVNVGGNEYRVANENSFLKITKTTNGWTIQDQKNTVYTLNAPWPMTGIRTFSWSLSSVVDVKNNSISYFYADGGEGHRLTEIRYGPNNNVVFAYEARPDSVLSFRSGHRSNISLRLKAVKSYAGARLASHTGFTYDVAGPLDSRSTLTKATVFDVDVDINGNPTLPSRSTIFEYAPQKESTATGLWDAPVYFANRYAVSRVWRLTTRISVDVNGDGVPESAVGYTYRNAKFGTFTAPFVLPDQGIESQKTRRQYKGYGKFKTHVLSRTFYDRAIVDINGDGFMDWMIRDNTGVWKVYFHNGTALNTVPERWNDPSGALHGHALYDVNGDGLPDLLHNSNYGLYWTVYENTGSGFSTVGYSTYLSQRPFSRGALVTMNGYIPAVLGHQPWNSKPLMTTVTDQASGAVKTVAYTLHAGIANAPKLKLWAVNKITTSSLNNDVETRSSSYSYSGGLYVPSKMEFRGFSTAVQIDDQTGITTSTTYDQSLVFQGRPSQVTTSLGGATLSSSTTTWAAKDLSNGKGTRHFAYPATVHQVSYDLNGVLLSDSTTESSGLDYDMFGHLLKSTTTNKNGYSKVLNNTYSGTDTCDPITTTVTKYNLVKNGIPAYVLNSYYYKVSLSRLNLRPTTSRNRTLRNAALRYFAVINGHNWGYTQVPYQVTTTIPNTSCWKVRQLTGAKVTSTVPADPVSLTPADTKARSSSFTYDASGFLKTETIEPLSAVWQQTDYTYDAYGNRETTTVSGAGITPRTTTVAYDINGMFPVSTTNALGHAESYTWDERFGKKKSLTGPNGLTTSWIYDGFGRKIREDRADGTFTSIDLSNAPISVTTTSSGNNPSTVWYDSLGRQIKSVSTGFDGTLIYNEVEYDTWGRKWKEYLPHTGNIGLFTAYKYDVLNRVIKVTNPNLDVATNSYSGLTTTSTNAKLQKTITTKNSLGKVIKVTDAANMSMTYGYDANGNLTRTTDAAGNVTTMSYDIRGRKKGMIDPDMGTWSYGYDALGNLTSQTDANGNVTTMVYDTLSRMTSRTETPADVTMNASNSSWVYDTKWIGALSREFNALKANEASATISKTYSYDVWGRVSSSSSVINGKTYAVDTSYVAIGLAGEGQVDTITYPNGLKIQRNYNANHFMAFVTNLSANTVVWQANTIDEFGRVRSESFNNGNINTTHDYHPVKGTLTGMKSTSLIDGVIQDWAYAYDAIGNMESRKNILPVNGYEEHFGYDDLNRVKSVRNAALGLPVKEYRYDAIGNITYKSDVGLADYTYDPNHPHAVQTAGGNTYAYDANGNQISGAGRTLAWTTFNKPSSISTANGFSSFAYDVNHNRVMKTAPTNRQSNIETFYVGKIFEQRVEKTVGGVQLGVTNVSSIYVGSKMVAQIEDQFDASGFALISSTPKYMHADHLGSVNVITDANGSVLTDAFGKEVGRLRFDVFGAPIDPKTGAALLGATADEKFGTTQTTRGYTGHEMDASTGLINMNARLYDPVLGRFISADTVITDPMRMQDYNRYSYVLNNPLMYTDPSGHSWWTSFRDSVLIPYGKQVMTIVITAALVYVGVDPYTATMIANFTTSAAFGGNFEENSLSALMAGATMAVANIPGVQESGLGGIFDIGVAQAGEAGQNGGGSSGFSVAAPSGYIAGVAAITAEGKSPSVAQTNAFQRLLKDESKIGTSSDYAAGIGKYAKIRPDNNIKVLEDFGDMSMLAATVLSVTAPPFAAPFVAMGIAFHGSAYYLGGSGNSSYIDAIMLGVDKGLSSIGVVGRVKGLIGAAEGYLINRAGSE